MRSPPVHKWRGWLPGLGVLWPIIGLFVLFVFNLIFAPGFFRLEVRDGHLYGTMIDILNQGSKVMLLALGMTLVIATGGVDLSVGSIMSIAGATAAVLVAQHDMSFGGAALIALGIAAAAGAINGTLVSWVGLQPIIATLILMVAGRGVGMLISGGQVVTFEDPAFVFLGNGHFAGLPFTLTIVLLVLAGTGLFLRKTAFGLLLEAVGDNETASRFCGVNTRLIKFMVYVVSGLCAGLAGLIATSNIKAADSSRVGEFMELDAIFAVVVGGTALTGGRFTLIGSIVGALLIQTLTTTMYNVGVPSDVAPVPKAVVIVAVCLLQSGKFRAHLRRLWKPRQPV